MSLRCKCLGTDEDFYDELKLDLNPQAFISEIICHPQCVNSDH